MLSAVPDEGEAVRRGAAAYLTKLVAERELLARVGQLLARRAPDGG